MTETEYTPTTEEVREYVMVGDPKPWEAPSPEVDERERRHGEAFDRWLAAHDHAVADAVRADQIEKDAQIAAGDHRPTGYGIGALNRGSRSQWYSRGRDQAGDAIRAQLADTLEASEHGAIKLDTAQAPIDDCRTLTKRLAEAEAILAAIEKQRSRMDYSGDWPDREVLARFGNAVETILAQSPTDVLAAHDRKVAAKALRDWADMQERTLETFSHVADDCDRSETSQWCEAIRLYADRIVSEPSTPEGEKP